MWFFSTTGCRTSQSPVKFNVVSGRIPPGTTPFTQGVGSGGITGRPTTEGLFAFTIEVQDQTGARDTESLSIRINPPRPVVITSQSDVLSPGTVGQSCCCGNLFADGGVPDYTWSLRAGQLPPGLRLSASPGRITGTPTTRGRSRSSSASPTRAARSPSGPSRSPSPEHGTSTRTTCGMGLSAKTVRRSMSANDAAPGSARSLAR
jgi:hypothetical protein